MKKVCRVLLIVLVAVAVGVGIYWLYSYWKVPPEFGAYTSFLEIAFAVNLLFGVWDGLAAKMSGWRISELRRLQGNIRASAIDAVRPALKNREVVCNRKCETIKKWGRRAGVMFAAVIALVLFVVGDSATVSGWKVVGIAGLAAPLPVSFIWIAIVSAVLVLRNRISYSDLSDPPEVVEKASRALENLT